MVASDASVLLHCTASGTSLRAVSCFFMPAGIESEQMRRQKLNLLPVLLVYWCAASWVAAADEQASGPLSHADLSVYPDEAGKLQPIRTPLDWEQRRQQILAGMQEAMGPLPDRRVGADFAVEILQDERTGGVRRLFLTIRGEDGDRIPLDLYLPAAIADAVDAKSLQSADSAVQIAAVLALHPTGMDGRRIVAGEGGRPGRQYGLELAQRGYVVAAPDYPSFGALADYDFAADDYVSGTMKAIVNHRRCTDFLVALGFVDGERLGVIGHSLGGHNAIFQAVFDERLKVIVSSCGWCPFADYYEGKIAGWTSDRYMPLLRTKYDLDVSRVPFDFYELVAALAPRTFVSVSPEEDSNFSVAGVRKAIPAAGSVYSLLDAREKLILMTPDCDHNFPADVRMQVYEIMDKTLQHKPDAFEPDYSLELPRIAATAPTAALQTFEVLPEFELQQTAAEPLVADPIAMAWDADGQLFVVEMRDYSEQDKESLGVIRRLTDSDGDGNFDQSQIFADQLSWPTAVIAANGGVFVGAPPEIWFLKDADGDGVAEVREHVFSGFSRSNVQGMMNSFHWGPDNRIYGSSSTTGATIRCVRHPERPAVTLQRQDFSFDPVTLELRAETGGGQHGMSFDDWGRRFVSANSDHAQSIVYDTRYLARGATANAAAARVSIAVDGGQAPVFRISPVEPWRIVRTRLRASGLVRGIVEGGGRPAGYFTGATGITVYRGDAWPEELRGTIVVGDVGSNIVHRKRLTPQGVTWKAERMDEGRELVASNDIWFRPAQFSNAPDGCLHILDMYREVIEHPASLPPDIKRHLDLTSGRDRGRLYRLAPKGHTPRPAPRLSEASAAELAGLLEHPNAWHRETACRLLFERQAKEVTEQVQLLLRNSQSGLARFHALGVLQGLGGLTAEDVIVGLRDSLPEVRERALVCSELHSESLQLQQAILQMGDESAPRVLMQLAFSAGELPDGSEKQALLTQIALRSGGDGWIRTAILTSLGTGAKEMLAVLSGQPDAAEAMLRELVSLVVNGVDTGQGLASLSAAVQAADKVPGRQVMLLQAAVAANRKLTAQPEFGELSGGLVRQAVATLRAQQATVEQTIGALQTLQLGQYADVHDLLLSLLDENESPQVRLAALRVLTGFAQSETAAELIERLPELTPVVAAAAREALLGRTDWSLALMQAVSAERLPAATVSPTELQRLAEVPEQAVRAQALQLLERVSGSSRVDVIRSYQVALTMQGDAARGAEVFRRHCSVCHRIGDVGHEVGPSLASMRNRGPDAILTNVLDPNREVNPAWRDYVAVTAAGTTHNGVLISESSSSLTLRRAEAKETSLLRADVEVLRDTGRSLMPEGLEREISPQQMADLIHWIMSGP